jgi:hypothetical protein
LDDVGIRQVRDPAISIDDQISARPEDTTMTEAPKTRVKRRQFIVDRKWQISLSVGVTATLLGAGAFTLLASYALTSDDRLESMTGREIGTMAMLINGIYFVLVALAAGFAIMFITHSVSGPARVLEQAVDGFTKGKFDGRLTLRKSDYLKRLAESLRKLRDRLMQQQDERDRLHEALMVALDRGDIGAARDLVEELQNIGLSEVPDDRRLAKVASLD